MMGREVIKWREHVLKFEQAYGVPEQYSVTFSIGMYYSLDEPSRREMATHAVVQALITIFRDGTPERAILEMVRKRKK